MHSYERTEWCWQRPPKETGLYHCSEGKGGQEGFTYMYHGDNKQ
jgi:hypothetical protein